MTDNFDRQYVEAEAQLEEQTTLAFERSQEIQAAIRRDVSLTDEQREERYVQRFGPIAENLESVASSFVQRWEAERDQLTQTVHAAVGDRFGDHLARVSELPDEKLDELMQSAIRTNQQDLQAAIAQTALTRKEGYSPVFNAWAERNPERAQALQRLHALPPTDRLITRATARGGVPPVTPEALQPRQEDHDHAASVRASNAVQAQEARTRRPIIRRVGSRVEVI